jgi:opacity protein-like surface antigen
MPLPFAAIVLAALAAAVLARPAAAQEAPSPRLGEITLAPARASTRAQPDPAAVDPDRPTFLNPFPGARRGGVYGRLGGLVIEQQEDGTLLEGGDRSRVTFDRGYGFVAAIGHHFGDVPISFEVEYAYRNITTDEAIAADGTRRSASGDLDLHTFSLNLLLDAPDLVSVFGVYAGAGVGLVASELRVKSRSGDTDVAITSEDVFLQAMAGVTVSVSRTVQLYGGLRWSTAGSIEQEQGEIEVDAEMVAAEAGLRVFF